MHIFIATPAAKRSLSGNHATTQRWRRILLRLGHRVTVATDWQPRCRADMRVDMMVALHAWRSAAAIKSFRAAVADCPLIVALTGTDIYRFIHSHPEPTLASIAAADRLVALHDLAYRTIPEQYRHKLSVIKQAAQPPPPRARRQKSFDICVCGHLRDEKDPLRAAYAVRHLTAPLPLPIRIRHYGKAHDAEWAGKATAEMQTNPAYHWYGEVAHWRVRRVYGECQAMVLSSKMEGGANVISEAAMAGLAVLASDIDGNIGLLGEDYRGYFPLGDERALAALMRRIMGDADFLAGLRRQMRGLRGDFTEAAEYRGWQRLLAGL